jgi:hypothetical protein
MAALGEAADDLSDRRLRAAVRSLATDRGHRRGALELTARILAPHVGAKTNSWPADMRASRPAWPTASTGRSR